MSYSFGRLMRKGLVLSPPSSDDICESCSKPVSPQGKAIAFRGGRILHFRCWNRLARLRAMELSGPAPPLHGRRSRNSRRRGA